MTACADDDPIGELERAEVRTYPGVLVQSPDVLLCELSPVLRAVAHADFGGNGLSSRRGGGVLMGRTDQRKDGKSEYREKSGETHGSSL